MIVTTRHNGNREIRTGWPDYTIPPRPAMQPVASGQRVTSERAFGLTLFGAAVRLVAGITASATIQVFQGTGGLKTLKDTSWQALLFNQPWLEQSSFDWLWDIAASLETCENAVLQKMKYQGKVTELIPVDMGLVDIYRDRQGNKVIAVRQQNGSVQKFSTDDMLHIRGQTLGAGVAGVSKIFQHRDPIGAMLAAQHFQGAYYRNHQRPDIALLFPAGVTQAQANEWRDSWTTEYGGADNFGKALPLGGGATIQPIPINLKDAQFLEARQFDIEEGSRIVDVHPLMLNHSPDRLQGDALAGAKDHFLHVQMPPRIIRIAQAFKADPDMAFTNGLYPQISLDDLAFLDPLTLAQVEHERIQDGTLLADEARGRRGEPPLPPIPDDPTQTPGMVPQLTPVGGAPNPKTSSPTDPEPEA